MGVVGAAGREFRQRGHDRRPDPLFASHECRRRSLGGPTRSAAARRRSARRLDAGFRERSHRVRGGGGRPGRPNAHAQACGEAMLSAKARIKPLLEARLNILGTVGSNAPYVGLLGTVLGIIKAAHDLTSQSADGANPNGTKLTSTRKLCAPYSSAVCRVSPINACLLDLRDGISFLTFQFQLVRYRERLFCARLSRLYSAVFQVVAEVAGFAAGGFPTAEDGIPKTHENINALDNNDAT